MQWRLFQVTTKEVCLLQILILAKSHQTDLRKNVGNLWVEFEFFWYCISQSTKEIELRFKNLNICSHRTSDLLKFSCYLNGKPIFFLLFIANNNKNYYLQQFNCSLWSFEFNEWINKQKVNEKIRFTNSNTKCS